jgi:hypothetical protein
MIFLAPQIDFGAPKIITECLGYLRKNAGCDRDKNHFKIQKY